MLKIQNISNSLMHLLLVFSLVICHQITPFIDPRCSSIPGVGSSVLMIGHAHKYIDDSLNDKNHHTKVVFVYFQKETETVQGYFDEYKLVFKIITHRGNEYLAVHFQVINETMVMIKTLFSAKPQLIASSFDLGNYESVFKEIQCGNLKFLYSSYGADPTADLPYAYFGGNRNSIGMSLLSELERLNSLEANTITTTTPTPTTTTSSSGSGTGSSSGSGGGVVTTKCTKTPQEFTLIDDSSIITPVDFSYCRENDPTFDSLLVGCLNSAVILVQITLLDETGNPQQILVGDISTSGLTTFEIKNVEASSDLTFATNTDNSNMQISYIPFGGTIQTLKCGTNASEVFPTSVTVAKENILGFSSDSNGSNALTILKLIYVDN